MALLRNITSKEAEGKESGGRNEVRAQNMEWQRKT